MFPAPSTDQRIPGSFLNSANPLKKAGISGYYFNQNDWGYMKHSYRLLLLAILSGAAAAALLLAFWRQQAELKELRASYAQLAAKLDQQEIDLPDTVGTRKTKGAETSPIPARPTPVTPRPVIAPKVPTDSINGAEPSQSIPKTKGPKPWEGEVLTINTPAAENMFILKEASAQAVADGLVATMKFNTPSNAPLGEFALVVRLPKRSDAKILNLEPADPSFYEGGATQVYPNKKFAIFRGISRTTGNIAFNLALSGPETADIRGTSGMKPFLLKVDSSSATIQDYPTR